MNKTLFEKQDGVGAKKIGIFNADFINISSMDWVELFSGYEKLYAITYSSSMTFMRQLFEKFDYGEVVFGYPEVMGASQRRLSSLQLHTLKIICSDDNILHLIELMEKERVRMFVSNDVKSHEKLFILKGFDKYRVIIGSANMSYSAFNGVQREIICVLDGKKAFDAFFEHYTSFRDKCTSFVNPLKIRKSIENAEDVSGDVGNAPVIDEVLSSGKTKTFEETDEQESLDDTYFDIDEKLFGASDASKTNEFDDKVQKSNGYKRYLITPESAKQIVENSQLNEAVLPSMTIDFEHNSVLVGQKYLNLNPNQESIRRAVALVLSHFSGWDVIKSPDRLKKTFWKLMVWYFCAPFIPRLRYLAEKYSRDINFKYPCFLLVYGDSNCGKTKFLEFLFRLMTGADAAIKDGPATTAGKLKKFKMACKNLPLNIDEVSASRFSAYSRELIKQDYFGRNSKLDSYAPIVFVSNEVQAVSIDIRKRCIVCRIDSSMEFSDTISNDSFCQRLDAAKKNTALYGEYLRRMLPEVYKLSQMIAGKEDNPEINILSISSKILSEIFKEYEENLPPFISELSLVGDYFDAMEMGYNAREALKIGLKIEPELFYIDHKENLLVYKDPNNDNKRLKNIQKELPVEWEAKIGLGSLMMNLEAAEKDLPLDKVYNRKGSKLTGLELLSLSTKAEPSQFVINEDANLLIFKTLNGDIKRLEDIQKELPSDWNASLTLNSLTVSLDKAREILDLSNIKKSKTSFLDNLINKFK